MAPALQPEIISGKIPALSKACNTPICATPLAPPPERQIPTLCFLQKKGDFCIFICKYFKN